MHLVYVNGGARKETHGAVGKTKTTESWPYLHTLMEQSMRHLKALHA